jgi:hypothetical protein
VSNKANIERVAIEKTCERFCLTYGGYRNNQHMFTTILSSMLHDVVKKFLKQYFNIKDGVTMMTIHGDGICLTSTEHFILAKAIESLSRYAEKEVAKATTYFEVGGELDTTYDCCSNDRCVSKTHAELRKIHGKKNVKNFYAYAFWNNSRIERCYQCNIPLSPTMAYVEPEFDYHREYSLTKKQLTNPQIAFDLVALFTAMPTSEYCLNGFHKREDQLGNWKVGLNQLRRQQKFIDDIISYAELVIKVLDEKA